MAARSYAAYALISVLVGRFCAKWPILLSRAAFIKSCCPKKLAFRLRPPFWAISGPSWGHLGASRVILGPSWGHLGAILKPSWGLVGLLASTLELHHQTCSSNKKTHALLKCKNRSRSALVQRKRSSAKRRCHRAFKPHFIEMPKSRSPYACAAKSLVGVNTNAKRLIPVSRKCL